MVGLSNVNNTTDINKPISTATQAALNLCATKNQPTFTRTVYGIDKSMVGLGNVDYTNSRLYLPAQAATANTLNVSGWYEI